jgi:hypothetical protein
VTGALVVDAWKDHKWTQKLERKENKVTEYDPETEELGDENEGDNSKKEKRKKRKHKK